MKHHEPRETLQPRRAHAVTPEPRQLALRLGALAVVALLTACSSTAYIDSRREAGKRISIGPSNADRVAICTGDGPTSPKVLKLATEKCAETGRVPRYESRTHLACNIKAPTRIFFRCMKPQAATLVEAKPADTKPSEAKPVEAKPGEAPPAAPKPAS